jgi:hypothetical protein
MSERRGGIIQLTVDGELFDCKGSFTANLGGDLNEMIVGSSGVTGHTSKPQPAFIEGLLTDRGGLSVKRLIAITSATVHLKLATGKVFVLTEAVYTGDGNITTDEGEINVKFSSSSGEEVTA